MKSCLFVNFLASLAILFITEDVVQSFDSFSFFLGRVRSLLSHRPNLVPNEGTFSVFEGGIRVSPLRDIRKVP